ncbi:unnamed protein product [Polarella glacialis]|uniref:Chloride channel protein n=1 Tax=Polarella glacialis TaxID=89957 RepID=A0A813J735_POLGL|nr:unnamed protein product [Polarella glacialis]
MAVAARILVRTCAEAEGSGFPDMKAMLFGKVLFGKGMVDFLSMRVLVVKATALSLLVAAGLPVGKEGPNVHMAACIARNLDPGFFESKDDAHNMAGGGGGGTGGAVTKMLLACCAVGVGASFSAPIAGALFSLELMLPQSYDSSGYWGCFTAGVIGSIVYAMERSWTAGATGLLPLMSSNVLPGEGSASQWPFLRLLIDILLGSLCGLLGGLWVRSHTYTAGVLKRWRLRDPALLAAAGPALNAGLLGENKQSWVQKKLQAVLGTAQWRDLGAVAAVTALHTICASMLPLLGGKPQPLLISDLFNKTLLFPEQQAVWVVPSVGLLGTLFLCFLMKWTFTALARNSRAHAQTLLAQVTEYIRSVSDWRRLSLMLVWSACCVVSGLSDWGLVLGSGRFRAVPAAASAKAQAQEATRGCGVVTEEMRGALMARFAIIGAAAFSSGVSRAFAMAISVFEVLALPNAVLPLCSATLASIYVANKVSLPFFDQNLVGRGWGGIPNITFSDRGSQPALSVMHHLDNATECLSQLTTLREVLYVLGSSQNAFFPVVRPTGHESGAALLEGTMTRAHVEQLLRSKDPMGEKPDMKIDLLDPEFQAPPDGSEALVNGCPFRCGPETTIKDVYLLMKVASTLDTAAFRRPFIISFLLRVSGRFVCLMSAS